MVTRVAPFWLIVLSRFAAVLILVLLLRHSGGPAPGDALPPRCADDNERRALIALSLAVVALFIVRPSRNPKCRARSPHTVRRHR